MTYQLSPLCNRLLVNIKQDVWPAPRQGAGHQIVCTLQVNIFSEGVYVILQGLPSRVGQLTRSAGLFPDELLFHLDIPGSFEFFQLHAQVPGSRVRFLFQVHEIRCLYRQEQGDYCQT